MYLFNTKQLKLGLMTSTLLCASLFLTACNVSSEVDNATDSVAATSDSPPIPETTSARVYRNTISSISTNDSTILSVNDNVTFTYEMRNHRTNEIVETSVAGGMAYKISSDSVPTHIPRAFNKALQNSLVGETYWVFFSKGMEDLPENLDKSDSYTVKFTVLAKNNNV